MRLFVICAALSALLSCSSDLERGYKQLKSADIVLPTYESIVINGKDSIISEDYFATKLKYIVFCDSTNCNQCSIDQIYSWEDFIEYSNTLDHQLSFLFIYFPPKNEIEEIHTALYLTEFNYPMILDSVGAFRSQNPHIPTNRMFHNFLIDEKGHIIFVGNPLLSDESSALFKETVEDYLNQNS